ncbi:MAG: hypothetical protein NUV76_10120 [Candidatus Kuenenia sp.]|nr:hypothetical protein [Candidatus Kuenenia sp.]
MKNVRAGDEARETRDERRKTKDEGCPSSIIRRPDTMRQASLLLEFFKKLKCYEVGDAHSSDDGEDNITPLRHILVKADVSFLKKFQ